MNETFVCPQCRRQFKDPQLRLCPLDGAVLFRPESLARVGMTLDKYRILSVLGEGGMGVVYQAEHVLLKKAVAIKILHKRYARRQAAVDSFLQEAQAASSIRHPNIVDVTDFGLADESVYLVMEYLAGFALDDVLARDGWIPLFNAVNVVRQIARALAAAHEAGIVHLDLKPENIFLIRREGRRRVVRMVTEGETPQFVVEKEDSFDFVKLLDFGVAKFLQGTSAPSRSGSKGQVMGTPHYMSPEQARGLPVDARSDIYSLGVLFYEMITGAVPFDSPSPMDVLNGHIHQPVPPPRLRNPMVTVDEGTNRTIMRCLEKDPARRFQSMDQLLLALTDCFTDQVFLRDAQAMPGAVEAGIATPRGVSRPPATPPSGIEAPSRPTPGRGSVTEDLRDLFDDRQDDPRPTGRHPRRASSGPSSSSKIPPPPPLPPARERVAAAGSSNEYETYGGWSYQEPPPSGDRWKAVPPTNTPPPFSGVNVSAEAEDEDDDDEVVFPVRYRHHL